MIVAMACLFARLSGARWADSQTEIKPIACMTVFFILLNIVRNAGQSTGFCKGFPGLDCRNTPVTAAPAVLTCDECVCLTAYLSNVCIRWLSALGRPQHYLPPPLRRELLLRAFFTVGLKAQAEVHFARVMAQNDAQIATTALQREALDHIHRMLDARESLYRLTNATLDTSELDLNEALLQLVAWVHPVTPIS